MKSRERRKQILSELEKNHSVNITELSQQLEVSSMTIRRDLNLFAQQGLVTLVHGGAVLNRGVTAIATMTIREKILQEEKSRIAHFCANLINESDAVFIDCGTTPKDIAEAIINRKNIIVMTNSLPVANILSSAKNLKLILTPGVYSANSHGFVGQMTADFIQKFKIDILFLGSKAFDLEQGITQPDIIDAETKRTMIRQAKKVVLAIDHTKLGTSSFMSAAMPKEIDVIVTDKDADPDLVEAIKKEGIDVFLV